MTLAEAAKPTSTKIMDTTKSPTELAAVPCSGIREDVFGWFDSPEQTMPAHDPGQAAPCVICAWPVNKHSEDNPLVTISLAVQAKRFRDRSYFFRAHKNCWERQTKHEQTLIESSLIDSICKPVCATCSRSLEDQAVEYAEALNDIADMLQLLTRSAATGRSDHEQHSNTKQYEQSQ